jgi:hypothetical protein
MMPPLQTKILNELIPYTGLELRPHWGLEKTGIYGPLIVAFRGPCEVPTGHLVDWEDRLANDFIRAKSMLHFIGEFFGTDLEAGVLYQRLFMAAAERLLIDSGLRAVRRGDDLFIDERKLSVSIATVSAVSVLLHWGINIDSTGAPVKACGLGEFGWNDTRVLDFAKQLLRYYSEEVQSVQIARCKVKPL